MGEDNLNCYEKLVSHIDKSMRAHPMSTVVMDVGNFKVLAVAKDIKKATRMLTASKKAHGVSIVFQKPRKNVIWILAVNSSCDAHLNMAES
jgi:hypothetical protein